MLLCWIEFSTHNNIFIIKDFRTISFIFIVISTTFRPICSPAFFRYLPNSGTFTEHRTTSFIEFTGVACADSEFDKYLKKAGGHIGRNVVEITIKMKTIVRKSLMIKIIKLPLRLILSFYPERDVHDFFYP